MSEQKPQPEVAFVAAALVLLVMPLLVVVGLAAFGFAASYLVPVDRMIGGEASWVLVSLLAVWVLVAVAIVLLLAARLARRTARHGSSVGGRRED